MRPKNLENLKQIGSREEIDKYKQAEKESHFDEKEIMPTAETREEEDRKEFDLRLNDLKSAIAEMEKHNKNSEGGPREEITEEMFENIMQMPVSEFMEYANGGKNINQPDLRSVHDQVSGVINGEFTQEYKGSKFRQVMNMPATKVFFAAFCLFLKFGVHAQAHEATVKEHPDAGHKIETNFDGGGKSPQLDREAAHDSYKVDSHTIHDASLDGLKEVSTVDIDQSFKVDKADISDSDAKQIEAAVDHFLDKIDSHNFNDFKDAVKQIKISSDERATKFGAEDKKAAPTLENNKKLSEARGKAATEVLKAAIEKHDFSKSGFSADQIKEIKNTDFKVVTPEKGYTKITELNKINPETGKAYTDKDVENMKINNKALFEKLTKECRYAKVDLMVESDVLQKVVSASESFIFMDDSPSSKSVHNAVAHDLIEQVSKQSDDKAKINMVYYSEGIDKVIEGKNVTQTVETLKVKKDDGAGHVENPFASAAKYLEKVVKNDGEKIKKGGEIPKDRVAVIAANEGLQDAKNIFKAIATMEKANIDVKGGRAVLAMYKPNDPKPMEIKLIDLKNNIEKAVQAKINSTIPSLTEKVNQSEKDLNAKLDRVINSVSDKSFKIIFGDKPGDKNEIKERLIKGDFKFSTEYKFHRSLGSDKDDAKNDYDKIRKVVFANEKLNADKAELKHAQTESVEHYLSSHNVQIKTLTDSQGHKATFEINEGEDQFTGPGYVAPKAEYMSL